MTDLHLLSLRDMAKGLRDGTFTATALLEHHLERIARIDPELNAFTFVATDEARAAAAASDVRFTQGAPLSALDGIPVALKDNLFAKGMPAVWGSELYRDHVAPHDELPVARLRAAGAVLLGKTNVPEFTLRGYTANSVYGSTGNPWNPALTPGGSSGGAVTAVSAGLAPLALGTDGGGSIRRPAGFAGIAGIKPSIGRIARGEGFPAILLDAEVVGPLARSADDLHLAMSVLAGADPRDPASRGFPMIPDALGAEQRGLRILYVPRLPGAPVEPDILAACDKLVQQMETLGHSVSVADDLPFDTGPVLSRWGMIGNVGLAMIAAREPEFAAKVSAPFVQQAEAGAGIVASDYLGLLGAIAQLRADVGVAFKQWDVIVTPASAANPWPRDEVFPKLIDGIEAGPRGHAAYTGWVNACGAPGLAIAAGLSASGMPVGIQLVGDLGSEDMLLTLGAALEATDPLGGKRPGCMS
ncbi:hypothetical protein AYJ57_24890 (plasmid) [Salipiger sp. CCB-MM3]|uniref:amidase n=1 Tax=Salipiger sp. CCB-MM3 TaxID=1792508 RepID=UPI00080A9A8E|nr:amidase [Salipiger sp. CCB-MM3]ANT63712.1 hypothetical protein AYJ57_24890 [Salipiger sp. CCB-MM3]